MPAGIFNEWSVNVLTKLSKDREISMQRQYHYKKCVFEFHAFNNSFTYTRVIQDNHISLFDNS